MKFSFFTTVTSPERHGVSTHQQLDFCLTACSVTTKKTTKAIASLAICDGNPPVTDGVPSSSAGNGDHFYAMTSWHRHHVIPENKVYGARSGMVCHASLLCVLCSNYRTMSWLCNHSPHHNVGLAATEQFSYILSIFLYWDVEYITMTSWHGYAFSITRPLYGKQTMDHPPPPPPHPHPIKFS